MALISIKGWERILKLSLLVISISSIIQWITIPIGNTVLWWFFNAITLFTFYKLSSRDNLPWPIFLWLIVIGIGGIRGVFVAEDYWDWRLLVNNLMFFLLCIASVTFSNPKVLGKILCFWFKYSWYLLVFLFPIMMSDGISKFLSPYTFLALFLPIITAKKRLLVLIAFILTMLFGIDSRSDMLKFLLCTTLGMMVTWNWALKRIDSIAKSVRLIFLFLPLLFLYLGITGKFNVFRIEEELGLKSYTITQSSGSKISAFEDTRTFLYEEEILSAVYNDCILMGATPAKGYLSDWFTRHDETNKGNQHYGVRDHCEVSILNVFNYWGIIGVVAYFMVFIMAGYFAIYKCNNIYVKLIGLYVSFRWFFAFIEDFSNFDLNMLFLWILIGMCFSKTFRKMTDDEFKFWIKNSL